MLLPGIFLELLKELSATEKPHRLEMQERGSLSSWEERKPELLSLIARLRIISRAMTLCVQITNIKILCQEQRNSATCVSYENLQNSPSYAFFILILQQIQSQGELNPHLRPRDIVLGHMSSF